MLEVSKDEEFYMREYCGCIYSLRDTNIWRFKNNREKISIGIKYYSSKKSLKINNVIYLTMQGMLYVLAFVHRYFSS